MIYEINERFDIEKLEIILQKHNNNRYEKRKPGIIGNQLSFN